MFSLSNERGYPLLSSPKLKELTKLNKKIMNVFLIITVTND
jgi:hypothetical protein